MARKQHDPDQHGDDTPPYVEDAAERETPPSNQAPDEPTQAAAAPQAADAEPELAATTSDDLASQGFTPDEVRRLVVISARAARSPEVRAAEAQMRRLRFTRWLIEHGVLDEWSA
jgi:hypothetical protein